MRFHRKKRHHSNPKKRHNRRHYSMKHNPARRRHRRHYRSNPVAAAVGFLNFKAIGLGAVGALVTRMIPNLLSLSGYMDYAAKLGILVLGGFGVNKMLGKDAGTGFMVGAGSILITDVVKNALTGNLANAPVAAAAAPAVAGFEHMSGFEKPALSGPSNDPYARIPDSAY